MKKYNIACFLVITIGVFVGGCSSLPLVKSNNPAEMTLEPNTVFKFPDIPVPSGFQLISQESFSFQSGNMRSAVLKYKGKAMPEQLINFYREQMPMYNWTLLNIVEYGERMLNFDRENETCVVSFTAKGKAITLTISVGPKPQLSTTTTKNKPLK